MTQVAPSNTNNIVKVYSVGVQGTPGSPGPSGSLQSSNSGSFSITGSLIVSGSNTFTNIGPAIFSGSVTSIGGFTGSLAGTAATASYISPTFISASAAASGFGGGGSTNTGSLMVTGSVTDSVLTFTKGDGSTFSLTVATGSGGGGSTNTGSFATTGSNSFIGEQIISSSLIVTNEIKGTGSIFLQPDVNDGRKLEIYNTAATDVHIKSNGGLTFLGDDTNYVLVDNSAAQTVSITGVNGVFVSSSLNVSGSLIVTGSINVPGSVINNLTSSFAVSSSFATTASFALNAGTTVSTASLLTTGSVTNNVLTFTKGDGSTFNLTVVTGSGGGSTDTGSFFVSASSYGPSGSIIFTQGDGSTQTVTVGSSLVSALLPNSEIIVSPTQSYGLIGTTSIDTFPEFKDLNPQNFQYSWGTAAQSANMAIFMFRDDTNSEWGDVSTGNYIAFNSFGNSNLPSYYEVNQAQHNSSSYGLIRLFQVTAVDPDNQFSAANSASFQGSVSIPNAAYPSRISLGRYNGSFFPSTNLATNYTNQVALVSGSTPSGSWLYIGNTPSSGSQFSATAGQYIGLSTNDSSFTYYVVNGKSYINASSDYFIGITPVAGEYFAATNTDVFIESARWIPAQPYYNSLSHITYPITPTSTADASGSIGDVSYDNNNFYVKRQIGWGKAPLLDINSGSLLTTASISDNTLTFTKSDGSTFNLTVTTGSSGGSAFPFSGSAIITGSLIISGSSNPSLAGDTKGFQVYNSGNTTLKATSKNGGVNFTTDGLGPHAWYLSTTGAGFGYTNNIYFHTTGSGMGNGSVLGILNWGKSNNDSFGSIRGFLQGVNQSTIGIYSSTFGALDYDGLPDISFISASLIDVNRKIETDKDIEITDSSKGIILRSPNGTRYRITINNSGILVSGSI